MQLLGDAVRSGPGVGTVSPNAASRDAEESTEEFEPKYFGQAIPFELGYRRLLEREIQSFQRALQICP